MLNLEDLRAGKIIQTRDGKHVQYINHKDDEVYGLVVEVDGSIVHYPINGKYNGISDHPLDIVYKKD